MENCTSPPIVELNKAIDQQDVDPTVVILTGSPEGKRKLLVNLAAKGRYQLLGVGECMLSPKHNAVGILGANNWDKPTLEAVINKVRASKRPLVVEVDYLQSARLLANCLPPAMIEAVIDETGQVDVMMVLKIDAESTYLAP